MLDIVGVLLNDAQEYTTKDAQVDEHLYDSPEYDPFWAAVQELDIPSYLHPKGPLPRDLERLYKTHPWLLGPMWSFARDMGFHTMSLATSGLLDRFPGARLIVVHMGEMILPHLHRIDHWLLKRDRGRVFPVDRSLPAERTIRDYLESNIFVTTAGTFSTPTLIHAITEIGAGQILFSVDNPYESITESAIWMDMLSVSSGDRERIGRGNALSVFPGLRGRLREEDSLQENRESVLFMTNPEFE